MSTTATPPLSPPPTKHHHHRPLPEEPGGASRTADDKKDGSHSEFKAEAPFHLFRDNHVGLDTYITANRQSGLPALLASRVRRQRGEGSATNFLFFTPPFPPFAWFIVRKRVGKSFKNVYHRSAPRLSRCSTRLSMAT